MDEELRAFLSTLVGVPLSVVFADGEAIEAVRDAGEGRLLLVPPFHVSDEDAYLVLPDDIGIEIVDILADGDLELLQEALRDGLLACGGLERTREGVVLEVEEAVTPREALDAGLPYAGEVAVAPGGDPVRELNTLDHARVTMVSALADERGLESMLRSREYAGASWRVPSHLRDQLAGVDPTYVWSRHLPDGRVAIELALFLEYEELVVLLRPAALAMARPVLELAPMGA